MFKNIDILFICRLYFAPVFKTMRFYNTLVTVNQNTLVD
jgi:hypothetical protein